MYHHRMPLPSVHHAFVQRATPQGCEEVSFVDGRTHEIRGRRVDAPRVIRQGGALEVIRGSVGALLKGAARFVYLAPLLVARGAADLVIVLFVVIVVLFFALLNAYIFVSALWWLRGRDKASFALEAPLRVPVGEATPLLRELGRGPIVDLGAAPLPAGQIARARGVIKRLEPTQSNEETVLWDLWSEGGELRLLGAIDFAVVGPGHIPAVVRLTSAPEVVSNTSVTTVGAYLFQASPTSARLFERAGIDAASVADTKASTLTLREGDEVEVTGLVTAGIDNVDGFELEGLVASVPLMGAERGDAGTPFRDKPGGPGVILGDRISIRRLGAR
jgi:hypothetical protein